MKITLPFDSKGSHFNAVDLLDHFKTEDIDEMIIGQQHTRLALHTKQYSLDYLLRTKVATRKGTAQATSHVVRQLIETNLFYKKRIFDSNTNHMCAAVCVKK